MSGLKRSPRTEATRQSSTVREPKEAANSRRNNNSTDKHIPLTAYTAAYHAARFRREHPHEYHLIALTAINLKRNGERVSIARVFEAVRHDKRLRQDERPFKLNNTLRPAMARLLMRDYPQLSGAFEVRRSLSDGLSYRSEGGEDGR